MSLPQTSQQRREEIASQAEHSAVLEGLRVSKEFEKDSQGYVAGKITADELVELTRKRLGVA
ncbi:MAG: hypothetical protein ACTHZN_09665 [Canibacter sp.]